jgi:hypothetical protein
MRLKDALSLAAKKISIALGLKCVLETKTYQRELNAVLIFSGPTCHYQHARNNYTFHTCVLSYRHFKLLLSPTYVQLARFFSRISCTPHPMHVDHVVSIQFVENAFVVRNPCIFHANQTEHSVLWRGFRLVGPFGPLLLLLTIVHREFEKVRNQGAFGTFNKLPIIS